MAKAAASSPLEDLDLSGEEVQRLTTAFKDPEFRRMFNAYAEELNDPENRRRYEEEITALERERGVEVRFVHPEPGHVLRTSQDGARHCFVNVCSNALVGAPSTQPGPGGGGGSHWSLPYSLAPGREYAGRSGSRYMVYDVVFHPDALALARRHKHFCQMLDATALEAVEKQFGVQLDRRNAKTLKTKYKGTPEAAVLRTPLPGSVPPPSDRKPEDPLSGFPYPYRYPAAGNSGSPGPQALNPPEPVRPTAPTEPRCSVVQRHHVDLQDYRCSRDSVPSPVPQELVVTIELPLLRSAEQAALEVTGKLLCLDSRNPDYRLRLSLPYAVDDSRGKAQFNKARRQLVVTLPVVQPAAPEESAGPSGTDDGAYASAREGEARRAGGRVGDPSPDRGAVEVTPAGVSPSGASKVAPALTRSGEAIDFQPEEPDFSRHSAWPPGLAAEPPSRAGSSPGDGDGRCPCTSSQGLDWESQVDRGSPRGDLSAEAGEDWESPGREPSGPAMDGPGPESTEPLCPPLQCNQDDESLTLLIQVPQIQPTSLQWDLNPLQYQLCFSTQDLVYSVFLKFAPENKLSTKEPVISVSSNNAVIVLVKSPESRGRWREWYCGLENDSLEEKLFVNEENVNEFLKEVLCSPLTQTMPLSPPLIEVLQVTDEKIQIHAELQECSHPDQLQGKEEINEESHLTEKENIEHFTTSTTDSDSSIAVKALEIDTCGSVTGFQQESLDVSQMLSGKSQQPEAKMEPAFVKEKSAAYSNEDTNYLKEPVVTKEKELDGDHISSLLNKNIVHDIPDFDSIRETNMQDGSVQIIKDHATHCAFSFQNSLLYDLD